MISLSRLAQLTRAAARPALLAFTFLVLPAPVSAQGFELVGTRARGMGGAFVAVADDAAATWWNPAGLPSSLIMDGVVEWRGLNLGTDGPIEEPGTHGQDRVVSVAVAFPAAGLSYARLHQWRLDEAPTAGTAAGRQDGGRVPTARSLLTQHLGLSLVQSLGDAVVVGVTTRLIRGGVASAGVSGGAGEAFERAADADRVTSTHGDVDAGVLVRLARWRLALAGRNLAAPSFTGANGVGWRLGRRARAGVAFVADADRAGRQPWVIAADADLTRDDEVAGGWRGVGAGVERWSADRRFGVRGGVEASTVGEARPAATGGVSVAVPGGFWLEVAGVAGARERRGWGLTAHVMF
jgi:F plasmid transfer operon, TraF, protein